jgi:LysR family glycine cleavage system transcriptional activator
MPTKLPFQALQVFIEVARLRGIRPAALALHITPGAVSRQVSVLEAHLGIALLERRAGQMARPTREGQRLLQQVQTPMDSVARSLNPAANARRARPVIINSPVTLAMHWLIPQVSRIEHSCPGLRLEIQTDDGPADPRLPVDLFIRRDPAELDPLPKQTFLDERSALVIAPRLLSGHEPSAAQLARWMRRWPRVSTRSRPDLWPTWCLHQGVDESQLAPPLMMDNTVLAIQAVMQGLGMGVLPLTFVSDALTARSLHLLPPAPVATGTYAFAVRPGRDSASVRALTAWLTSHCPPALRPTI